MRNKYKILVGKPKRKRSVGRLGRRWEDNINMNIKEEDMDWIHLTQDGDQWWALVNTVMNLRVPQKTGNILI
jgi:hypothetical protein